MSSPAGKGDAPRDGFDREAFRKGWERTFGDREKPEEPTDNSCNVPEADHDDRR